MGISSWFKKSDPPQKAPPQSSPSNDAIPDIVKTAANHVMLYEDILQQFFKSEALVVPESLLPCTKKEMRQHSAVFAAWCDRTGDKDWIDALKSLHPFLSRFVPDAQVNVISERVTTAIPTWKLPPGEKPNPSQLKTLVLYSLYPNILLEQELFSDEIPAFIKAARDNPIWK